MKRLCSHREYDGGRLDAEDTVDILRANSERRRDTSSVERGVLWKKVGGRLRGLNFRRKALFAYPDASLLAAERPQERHQDEEREEGRLEDQQI